MKIKKISLALLAMSIIVLPIYAQQKMTLNLGHGAVPDNPRHIVALQFADYVKEKTNGRIAIVVHPSESLGSDRQMAEKVASGALDMSINSQGPIASYNTKLNVVGLPFLFSKPEQAYAVLDGEVGDQISKECIPSGFRILAYWDNGFRHITNSKRPIYVPKDLQGLKIRTPEDKMTISIFRALGANPQPLAFGELYMALSQGLFDGQENPIVNIYASKLYEVQKYLSLTNHKYETCPLIISEFTWKKLSKADQDLLLEAARKFATVHREMNNKANEDLLAELKKYGIQVNTADVAAMKAATASVYKEYEPIFGKDLINKVQEIAQKY